eukprot:6211179-Pleurochrysis_carterae.AAC.2
MGRSRHPPPPLLCRGVLWVGASTAAGRGPIAAGRGPIAAGRGPVAARVHVTFGARTDVLEEGGASVDVARREADAAAPLSREVFVVHFL